MPIRKTTLSLLIVATFMAPPAYSSPAVIRSPLSSPGIIVFGVGQDSYATSLQIDRNGKILAAGGATSMEGRPAGVLVRFSPDGSLDETLNRTGVVVAEPPEAGIYNVDLATARDGKIVMTATSEGGKNRADVMALRFDQDGQLDKTFNASGRLVVDLLGDHDHSYAVAVQKDGKIVIVGNTLSSLFFIPGWRYDFLTLRITGDGRLDEAFGKAGKVVTRVGRVSEDSARALTIQPDGKIVVTGLTHIGGYESQLAVVRYTDDGRKDGSFGKHGKVVIPFGESSERISAVGYSVALQVDGRIIVGATLHTYGSGHNSGAVIRLDPDGNLDSFWGKGGSAAGKEKDYFPCAIYDVAVQDDGMVVYTGSSGEGAMVVGRLLANGGPDLSFGDAGVVKIKFERHSAEGHRLAVQPDGKILIAGSVRGAGAGSGDKGARSNRVDMVLARLHADGSLDLSWGAGSERKALTDAQNRHSGYGPSGTFRSEAAGVN